MAFFRAAKLSLRTKVHRVAKKPNPTKVEKLRQLKRESLIKAREQYPDIFISDQLHNKIVYTLQTKSPEELIEDGGFVKQENSEFWLSNQVGKSYDTCNNRGAICFSLLPKVTALFLPETKVGQQKFYIYAMPLEDECIFLGGKWRQVITPKATPLPNFWLCREIVKIEQGRMILGPVMGQGDESKVISGEDYSAYLDKKGLEIPASIGISEDFPEHDIQDTLMTKKFILDVAKHYEDVLHSETKKNFLTL